MTKFENGLDRYSVVTSFNDGFYQLRKTDTSCLSDIAFTPRLGPSSDDESHGSSRENVRQSNQLSKLVVEYMSKTKWSDVYGLSYIETMKLTYAEWIRMQAQLNSQGLKALRDLELPDKP